MFERCSELANIARTRPPVSAWLLLLAIFAALDTTVLARPLVTSEAIASDVPLPPELIGRGERNRALFRRATASQEGFCAFVADSVALLEPLRHAVETAPPPEPVPDVYGAAAAGALVSMSEGGIRVSLHWTNVLAVATPPSRPLILATKDLWGEGALGIWIEQRTDLGGCVRPELATSALKTLAATWRTAPACLRKSLKPELSRLLSWMADDHCFCEPDLKRAELERGLAKNASVLEQMPDLGPTFARKLRAGTSAHDVSFNCMGPG